MIRQSKRSSLGHLHSHKRLAKDKQDTISLQGTLAYHVLSYGNILARLLAVARLLDATKRRLRGRRVARVHADHTGLEVLQQAPRAVHVLGEVVFWKRRWSALLFFLFFFFCSCWKGSAMLSRTPDFLSSTYNLQGPCSYHWPISRPHPRCQRGTEP